MDSSHDIVRPSVRRDAADGARPRRRQGRPEPRSFAWGGAHRTWRLLASAIALALLAACASPERSSDLTTFHDDGGVHDDGDVGALLPGPRVGTDDPDGSDPLLGVGGIGNRSVERFLRPQAPERRAERRSRNISLVGHLELDPTGEGVHADVAGYRDLAFVGKWAGTCPGTGVDIIDISDPSAPVKLSSTTDHTGTSMEDMQAISIAGRDVLAVGLQACFGVPGDNLTGLELFDISDPANPEFLSFFEVGSIGVHEFDLTRAPGGRTLALLAVPFLEVETASPESGLTDGLGDLLIVDISDPADPVLVADWGVLAEPELGLDFYLDSLQGQQAAVFLHSARANANGTLAYLSYWDAGFITLDISVPERPVFLGHTRYPPEAEGNAHSVDTARGGNILIGADEDFAPFETVLRSEAFAGSRPAVEAFFSPPLALLPDRELIGDVVHVGRGCPADAIEPGSPADPYLDDPDGAIALIQRGACRFDHKVARAQQAGAIGVLVYNLDGDETLMTMGGENPTPMPDGTLVEITIPAIFVQFGTGDRLREESVTASATAEFVGWGFLRFFDVRDPGNPLEIATFATDNTMNPDVATQGIWSVHNPEVVGSTLYASWYSDGVRVIDISQPARPREIGYWAGEGAPEDAPPVNIWGVAPHRNLILASDRNHGLYILATVPGRPR
jgi:hypothetical protein